MRYLFNIVDECKLDLALLGTLSPGLIQRRYRVSYEKALQICQDLGVEIELPKPVPQDETPEELAERLRSNSERMREERLRRYNEIKSRGVCPRCKKNKPGPGRVACRQCSEYSYSNRMLREGAYGS
jgi:hypothetical protein